MASNVDYEPPRKVRKTSFSFDRETAVKELDGRGYTMIPGILTETECDTYTNQYKSWIDQFGQDDFPHSRNSVIQGYRIGQFEPGWNARLKTKAVFASLWKTQKLLTSVDAIAVARPPEQDGSPFADEGQTWFHLDQGGQRQGLHAYQGALYLEETTDTDYCFRVMEGSHKHHEQLFVDFPGALGATKRSEFLRLQPKKLDWYRKKDIVSRKVPCPKGGLILWDSRLIHDSVRPQHGRPNTDRWRFVVFVCMTPAIWASTKDIERKQQAYAKRMLTSHWPSQGVRIFRHSNCPPPDHVDKLTQLPEVATTREVRLLMGVDRYDFDDGESNGPGWEPQWRK
ncbi:hypothetical protein ScPMuIL_008992 [Solemya velum]